MFPPKGNRLTREVLYRIEEMKKPPPKKPTRPARCLRARDLDRIRGGALNAYLTCTAEVNGRVAN